MADKWINITVNPDNTLTYRDEAGNPARRLEVTKDDRVGWSISPHRPFQIRFNGDTPLKDWRDGDPKTPNSDFQIPLRRLKVKPGDVFKYTTHVIGLPPDDPDIQIVDVKRFPLGVLAGLGVFALGAAAGAAAVAFRRRASLPRSEGPPPTAQR